MRLLPLRPDVCAQLAVGDWTALPPGLGLDAVADHVRTLATTSVGLYARHGAHAPWLIYLAVDSRLGAAVGSCGFWGPCRDRIAEVGVFTFPPFEGRGYGFRMTRDLVDLALQQPEVETLIHCTANARGAASRLLTRFGFVCEGPVDDPKRGPLWRWSLDLRHHTAGHSSGSNPHADGI